MPILSRFAIRASMMRKRFSRVSFFFADITQNTVMRRYPGGSDWKNFHALRLASRRFLNAGDSVMWRFSNEYGAAAILSRRSNAAMPGRAALPAAMSCFMRAMLTRLQLLLVLRGE